MTIKQLGISILLGIIACGSCGRAQNGFTEEELSLIHEADSIMRVLTVCDPADLAVLRAPSIDFSAQALMSDEYAALCSLMVATVTHPSQDGVGIAGPQVGLNRRVVAVQRFDKEPVAIGGEPVADGTSVPDAGDGGTEEGEVDYPFEVYPNVRIVWASDSLAYGPEGCLSVPGRRGDVLRSQEIVIEYALAEGRDGITMVRDTVRGFTAVIFQHEIDHLDGVLYIDRL